MTGPAPTSVGPHGRTQGGAGRIVEPSRLELSSIAGFEERFVQDPINGLMQNAITRVPLDQIALRHVVVADMNHAVSNRLDDWSPTQQGKSGRCWIFAGLNFLRSDAGRQMGMANFEFSQAHTMFWDKIERANFFLEAFLDTADRPIDDRTVAYLLDNLANDGGQWHMFVALVRKHGVVPRDLMPETESSQDTARMNARLRSVLRKGAKAMREAGDHSSEARRIKTEVLETVYKVLSLHLGSPPRRFAWQWIDDKKTFHRDEVTTPQEFAERYVQQPLEDFVCLISDPRRAGSIGESLTVRFLGNVIEAPPVRYLNVDVATLRAATLATLEAGDLVWFGCDTDKMVHEDLGIWDSDLYAYDHVYRAELGMSKEDRVAYHESRMTHAMIFTGVDSVDGTPIRWRVENSWGSAKGQSGFYTMNDNWFGEYVFEVVIRRSVLSEGLQRAVDLEPTVLDPWDPMGALAG
jgi:bleomycin hydrolase